MTNTRILHLNNVDVSNGGCVLYVMSRDQRVLDNHALLAAQERALSLKVPLLVVFNLMPSTGVRSREHYEFMITGLRQIEVELKKHNIPFRIVSGSSIQKIKDFIQSTHACHVFFDFNPLRGVRKMQKEIAESVSCGCSVVDTHNIVPLWVLSDKEEFAAHTIRNKIHKNLGTWLVEPGIVVNHPYSFTQNIKSLSWDEVDSVVDQVNPCGIEVQLISGESAAREHLHKFITNNLATYASDRNIPNINGQSNLSPYLHFGHISSLRVALELLKVATEPPLLLQAGKLASYEGLPTQMDSINALLEELIVRKELADNFCFYNDHYDSLRGAKEWAKTSLLEHSDDARDHVYSLQQWESATTHDDAWNAAQTELMQTGKMHGYMRMYWAKKILEWSASADDAIRTAIYLNDHYSIDGGDPNGYTGIMWSIAGIHDRPWFDRTVYGKIRYMNAGGLARKFDLKGYIDLWHK